ncbi:aminotransferase class I/II-fold pyridoxal phosphate-dependent enzyme [Vibrio sinensis]|uniref:cysteine-S-conjugate beta-lyase n=1 Tax=Vibrio sinensis TaxID=2302434 RepID=A0A3A6QQD4_9VIBR|nr:aminotransferase class I/II-fold pyridoxal phosphate-dependent enzyme [Vibrio sinensis]RJX70042.1 aminotransferase class I/II-fold pyridoxal phosphate-dependent enzyme [Vibrio sinensis]
MSFDFSAPTDRLNTYSTQWDYVGDRFGCSNLLPFTISDMDFAAAPCITNALQQRLDHGVFGYSRWNHADFKQSICHWFLSQYQTNLDENSLVYGPSVMYIIARLIELWSQPGDSVLYFDPAYDAFKPIIETAERKAIPNPLTATESGKEKHYNIDWSLLNEQASDPRCRILLLCNPHNPTGKVWSQAELTQIADIAHRHQISVISDDIHMDICFTPYTPWVNVAQSNQWALVSSASKSFNIPALSGAYAAIGCEQTKQAYLNKLKLTDGLSSPSIFGVLATMSAYREGAPWLESLKEYLYQNLLFVAEQLNHAFPELSVCPPQGTYLAWIDLSPLNIDMDALQHALIHDQKIAIMRGDCYGSLGRNHLRLNVGCQRSKVEQGVKGLIKAIHSLQ